MATLAASQIQPVRYRMPKIEPETFREKLYLLVIDKVVIGALIAIAFIVYDQWKTQEVRRYTDTQEEVQLAFRRAEYVKQLIPIVLASEQDVRYRAHALGALVETRSIDANSAVNFAGKLLDSNLWVGSEDGEIPSPTSEDYFLDVMRKSMPSGLQALLKAYDDTRYSRRTGYTGNGPSLQEIVAADDWMNRDTTCRSARPLFSSRNGEACTVRGAASLQASREQGVVG
jgi:hypothetical protein